MGTLEPIVTGKGVPVRALCAVVSLEEMWDNIGWFPRQGAINVRASFIIVPREDLEASAFLDGNVIVTAVSLINSCKLSLPVTEAVLKATQVDSGLWNVSCTLSLELGPLKAQLGEYSTHLKKIDVPLLLGVSELDVDTMPMFPQSSTVELEFHPSGMPIMWKNWGPARVLGNPVGAAAKNTPTTFSSLTRGLSSRLSSKRG
jgi:hypothetical protein